MKVYFTVASFILVAALISCNTIDNYFPIYDADTPDTWHNKKRFRQHLETSPTDDVKEIYCYGDYLGIDYKVLIAFSCDTSTINRIVQAKNLAPTDNKGEGLYFAGDFRWWDKNKIRSLSPFRQGEEYKYWEYLWYDTTTRKAYYLEYSM